MVARINKLFVFKKIGYNRKNGQIMEKEEYIKQSINITKEHDEHNKNCIKATGFESKEEALTLLSQQGNLLYLAPEKFKADRDVAKTALKSCGGSYFHIADELKK